MTNIKTATTRAIKKLAAKKIPSAVLDVEIILAFVLKKSREFILTYPEKELTAGQEKNFWQLISRRTKNEPIAYLVGEKEFYGLKFKVNKNTLIPRPESELIIDEIKNILTPNQKITLADIGTGSGCLAITLKTLFPKIHIIATDKSALALNVARKNARNLKATITFKKADILTGLKNESIDILIANLPYLKNNLKLKTKAEQAIKFEPHSALYAGPDGLDCFKKLFEQVKNKKMKPTAIILEIGSDQGQKIISLAKKYLPEYRATIKKDFCGKNRIAILNK